MHRAGATTAPPTGLETSTLEQPFRLLRRRRCGQRHLSIAFNAESAFALLRVWELRVHFASTTLAEQAPDAVIAYAEHYLLSDNTSNPFRLTPSV